MRCLFFGKVAEEAAQKNLHLTLSCTYLSIGKLKMKHTALIAALLALSLSACGEKAAETAAAPATEAAAPVAAPATEAAAPAAASATEAAAPASEAPAAAK